MTDDEWEARREHAIRTAFETGRPVFADTNGILRFGDGDREVVPIPPPAPPSTHVSWWKRLVQRLRGRS